jgi:hypothetical protein
VRGGKGYDSGQIVSVPILFEHNPDKAIGVVRHEDGRLLVEFTSDMEISRDMFFEIFGNCGAQVEFCETPNGNLIVKKATILEFSLSLLSACLNSVDTPADKSSDTPARGLHFDED